ncbi:hypothetical protein SCLCIDRAFT_749189 [Scleroderma citrinum Foug A]|uniref:Uncharacterized protein n=1 Tax=Scleroderma citrinum Foug A TaxID=1036808 RepID=A0A0C2YM95_9AGAM|nr:hypothetical protein SCLCIDRAFT_749189 [Scleroderma citrinum Foug A]
MRLINVNALLDVEKSISERKEPDPRTAVLVELHGTALAETKYATLSHCWGPPEQELQFKEMKKLIIMDERRRNEIRKRSGYKKILDTCKQARQDQLDWVWVDTCCINKDSSSELSEAINSMFRWYAKSERCYAYLHDIDELVFPSEPDMERFYEFNGWPKWFSRGWTLQELVAPKDVYFFNRRWTFIGDKKCLAKTLEVITRIAGRILEDGLSSKRPCVAQIMSWAADRKTTREEDRAYSLLGLLGVHMPMMYGEGKNAFRRLQLEVIRMTNDHSIFAWGHSRETGWSSGFLAPDPSFFRDCSCVEKMELDEFILHHKNEIPEDELRKVMDPEERLRTFTITNDGIQIWLLLRHWRGSTSLFQTDLACRSLSSVRSITIHVAQFKSKYFRYFGYCEAPLYEKMQFQQVFFPYEDGIHPSHFTFNLDLRTLFHDGFIQHHVFPEVKLTDGTLTLTDVDDCAIILFSHPNRRIHFAIAFHYCFGQPLIHVICCEPPGDQQRCVREVYRGVRKDGPDKVNRMVKRWSNSRTDCLAKHVHIPRSIHGVKVAYAWPSESPNSCVVMIDVAQCTGCCDSTWHGWNGFDIGLTVSGLLKAPMPRVATYPVYGLFVDPSYMRFVLAEPGIELRLGDYGRQLRNGSLAREGNIFDLATEYGIALDPDKHNMIFDRDTVSMERDVVKAVYDGQDNFCTVLLRNATGWSLPNDQTMVFLLKFLSSRLPTRLAGRHLVSTVIHCSECCYTEDVQGVSATTWPKCTGDGVSNTN